MTEKDEMTEKYKKLKEIAMEMQDELGLNDSDGSPIMWWEEIMEYLLRAYELNS